MVEHEIFSANKYENATIVGIFIFISRKKFMLSCVEHDKCFITSGQFQLWTNPLQNTRDENIKNQAAKSGL